MNGFVETLTALTPREQIMWAALLCSQVLDVVSTNLVLRRGGRELNPIVARVMTLTGDLWGVVKIGFVMGVVWMLYTPQIEWLVWAGAALTAAVALRNLKIARDMRGSK